MAEVWKADYLEAQKRAEQVEPLKERISELDLEIMKLKAMLFDQMIKTA